MLLFLLNSRFGQLVVGASGSGKTCLVRRLRLHALEKANEPEDVGKELRGRASFDYWSSRSWSVTLSCVKVLFSRA